SDSVGLLARRQFASSYCVTSSTSSSIHKLTGVRRPNIFLTALFRPVVCKNGVRRANSLGIGRRLPGTAADRRRRRPDLVRSGTMHRFDLRVAFRTVVDVLADVARLGCLTLHSRAQLAAENLFLRKQLALYLERQVKRRATDATRITLVALSRLATGVSCW